VGQATIDAIYPTARDRLQFPEHLREGLEPHRVAEIYMFGTEQPNHWVDIGETIDVKIAALLRHESQVGSWNGIAEWIKKRAGLLGEGQGLAYAEAFRRIVMRR
jgi:LmbE family N-acetylglucosaminyl deacetylase